MVDFDVVGGVVEWFMGIHYLSRVLGSQCGQCGELKVGVEEEGVERGAMVRVSVKGNE